MTKASLLRAWILPAQFTGLLVYLTTIKFCRRMHFRIIASHALESSHSRSIHAVETVMILLHVSM